MLKKFYKTVLKKIRFDSRNPIQKYDDFWVISVSDSNGNPSLTIFYSIDGFRIRDERYGEYREDIDILQNRSDSIKGFFKSYRLLFMDRHIFDDLENWDGFTGYDVISEALLFARDHGKEAKAALKETQSYQKLAPLPSEETIKDEISTILHNRLIVTDRQIVKSPCGHINGSGKLLAELNIGHLGTYTCPVCGDEHIVFNAKFPPSEYLRFDTKGDQLIVGVYRFSFDKLGDGFEVELKPRYTVNILSRGWYGRMSVKAYEICNGRAKEIYSTLPNEMNYFILTNAVQAYEVLDTFGGYDENMVRIIDYVLNHPNGQDLAYILCEKEGMSFAAEHEIFHLFDERSPVWFEEAMKELTYHPECIDLIKDEKMSSFEILVFLEHVKCGKDFTHHELEILRAYSRTPGFSYGALIDGLKVFLKYASLQDVLFYLEDEQYNFKLLESYWKLLEKMPQYDMDEDTLFPGDLRIAHDFTKYEYEWSNERKYQDYRIRTHWVELFDQGFVDSNDSFVLMPYESLEQIEEDGVSLICNSMDLNVNRYMDGRTLLFALRKLDDPEKPYVSLEVRDHELKRILSVDYPDVYRLTENYPNTDIKEFVINYCAKHNIAY